MAVNEVLCLTGNYSSRGSTKPIKFALHTMEGFTGPNGAMDCAIYFQGNVGASAHWCIDNFHPNQAVCGVYEQYAAWTQSSYNSLSFGVEQAGYASYSRDKWLNEQGTLLSTTASLMRQTCDKYGIPLRSLSASEAQDSWTKGVCDHVDFGSGGGGHHDCGSGYPMDKVIEWAKAGTGTTPEPIPPPVGASSHVTASSAYDSAGRLHHCAINQREEVCYKGPNGNWYPISTETWHKAQSGLGMVINAATDEITITWTQKDGDAVHMWQKHVDNPEQWRLTRLGASYM